jgi:hypothetical protein
MPFRKGQSGNPEGGSASATARSRLSRMVVFDLREAARKHCPEAVEVFAKAMRSKDEKIRVLAADLLLSRGYGKPPVSIEATTTHKFAVVPEVLSEEDWLATRGQGYGKPKPPDAMHEGNILDLKVTNEDDPTKLN